MLPMKDVAEELRALRNSAAKAPPSFADLEKIAEKVHKTKHERNPRQSSVVGRMLPECYTAFSFTNVPMQNLHEETLFYIFYSLHDSDIQIRAYNELINKGYFYSRTLECFVMLSYTKLPDGKKKNIILFDPIEWQKSVREVVFDTAFVDGLEAHVDEKDCQAS